MTPLADTRGIVNLRMMRADLHGLPEFALAPPLSLRGYRTGDEAEWLRIHLAAERLVPCDETTFRKQFGHNEEELTRRQCYLCDAAGAPIGTATAWLNAHYPQRNWARLHWVAILPEYQGRGLAKPLLAALLRRMADLGYDGAYLTTQSSRIPAIRLYLKFGFVPLIAAERDEEVWRRLGTKTATNGI